ncbi:MAG: ABC transporter substrate-binding protein [Planctomycetota bacterium]|jgi:branched-chain amino acid transport system substrate-binding protein|nr:ABC transporter substrate-binding protein [Planctomycetota bacterium]
MPIRGIVVFFVLCGYSLLYLGNPISPAAEAAKPEAEVVYQGEIVLGASLPLTGELETYGQSAYYGARTRIKLINDAGGVNGKKLVVEWRDNQSDAAKALEDVRELVEKFKVPAIIGPLMSESVLAVRSFAIENKVVIISPMATIDVVEEDDPWVFLVNFRSSDEVDGLIKFQANSFGATTCAIIYDSRYYYSSKMAEMFAKSFVANAGLVLGRESFVDPASGELVYDWALELLSATRPDFIFVPCYALEATELIHAARRLGIRTRLVGSSTWDNQLVFDGSGIRLEGTCFSSGLFEQSFNFRPFQVFFTAMEQAGMDNPDAGAACAFDSVSILISALANGESPEDIQAGILKIKRMPLATGRTTMSPDGEAIKPVLIRMVERSDGQLKPVYAERYDP